MNTNDTRSATPKTWGISSSEFLMGLRDKPVQVTTLDGKLYRGILRGVDLYDVVIEQSGASFLLAKHAIKMMQAEPTASKPSAGDVSK